MMGELYQLLNAFYWVVAAVGYGALLVLLFAFGTWIYDRWL